MTWSASMESYREIVAPRGPHISIQQAAEVLSDARKKGARLWLHGGDLHFSAPKGALAPPEIERLRLHKREIVELLESSAEDAPLSFSQLAHWNLFRLRERRTERTVATANRLLGRLDVAALQNSLAQLVARHD